MCYQKRWAKNWQELKYCSQKCRKNKPDKLDKTLEEHYLELVKTKTLVTEQDVARALNEAPTDLRERIRKAARRLVATGNYALTQNGKTVDPSSAKGPINLRRKA